MTLTQNSHHTIAVFEAQFRPTTLTGNGVGRVLGVLTLGVDAVTHNQNLLIYSSIISLSQTLG